MKMLLHAPLPCTAATALRAVAPASARAQKAVGNVAPFPSPKPGDYYTGTGAIYEYCYGAAWNGEKRRWQLRAGQQGWGVRLLNTGLNRYPAPLATLCGRPVTNADYLFYMLDCADLDLSDFCQGNITSADYMLYGAAPFGTIYLHGLQLSHLTHSHMFFAGMDGTGPAYPDRIFCGSPENERWLQECDSLPLMVILWQ